MRRRASRHAGVAMRNMPPEPEQTRRIEAEYERNGALQYLAAWDVHRGMVMGRCEAKTGIEPFGRLVNQILEQEPYARCGAVVFDCGQRLVASRPGVGGAACVGATSGSSWCIRRCMRVG